MFCLTLRLLCAKIKSVTLNELLRDERTTAMVRDTPIFVGKNLEAFKHFAAECTEGMMKDNRIPSLLCLKNGEFAGNVIAAVDKASCGKDWGMIEIGVRVSTDGGKSFGKLKTVFSPPVRKYPYDENDFGSAFCIDPLMIEAPTGKIVFLIDFFPESMGLDGENLLENGSGYVEIDGKKYLALHTSRSALDKKPYKDDRVFTLREDGFVYDDAGVKTRYYIPKRHNPSLAFATYGDMYYAVGEGEYVTKFPPLIPEKENGHDIYVGNIFLSCGKPEFTADNPVFVQKWDVLDTDGTTLCTETSPAPLRAAVTSYILRLESYDGGETFTQPVDLNGSVKSREDGVFLGVTPGNGIALKHGEFAGRLLAPVYTLERPSVIISDDNGKTWRKCISASCANIDECQLCETPDGKIYCFGRPKGGGYIPLSVSVDGGETFSKCPNTDIHSPQCQRSVLSLPTDVVLPDGLENDGFYIVMVTPTGHNGRDTTRTDGTLFLGHVEGNKIKFIKAYNLKDSGKYSSFGSYDDFFAYSSCCVLPDGRIGVLYEAYASGYITFCAVRL